MNRLFGALGVLLAGVSVCVAARADEAPALFSIWHVDGPDVSVRFSLPAAAARRLLPAGGRFEPSAAATAAGAALGVSSAGGDCPAMVLNDYVGRVDILPDHDGGVSFEMRFRCSVARGMVLHDRVLFDALPFHVDNARVQRGTTAPALRLFTHDREDLALPPDGPIPGEPTLVLLSRGLLRLRGGLDAMALVAGLLLLRRTGDNGSSLLALSLGYAAAVAIGWSRLVVPDLPLAAAGMAAMPAVLGLCALRRQSPPRPIGNRIAPTIIAASAVVSVAVVALWAVRGWAAASVATGLLFLALGDAVLAGAAPRLYRPVLVPAALFGLLDGAVWAQHLAILHLPRASLLLPQLAYAIGACAGIAAVWALLSALLRVTRHRFAPIRRLGAELSAASLLGFGLFWFVRTMTHA